MADYVVHIVATDTLEPIILALKKIENYEFAEQLSPEERDNICRVIGKFAHATKRRIQIDSYFCGEFINILNNCSCLPEDIFEKTREFEKSDKMNPPLEKRAKLISPDRLKQDIHRINHEAAAHDIDTLVSGPVIDNLPLYRNDEIPIPPAEDIFDEARESEKSDKNPPEDVHGIIHEAGARDIDSVVNGPVTDKLPLYKNDEITIPPAEDPYQEE